ncbi:hypothetical protein DID88_005760 [Monilinia fructigena]|uniref:Uncharacterized protein n=1 Tax=Monilinia fructigena TaxID=38457 RepID=A0A395J0T3_9HELO|nr:hypothetical protein DID88_005760 [Monilinia fructigena]
MRAKYYGAQVITYRNFVLKILEHSHAVETSNTAERGLDDFRNGIEALIYAKNGIQALVNSTRAFHGLGEGRLLTMGNVLTLQAAWNDNILRPLFDGILDKQGLSELLNRTLSFLGIVATRSSALYTDMKILVNAGKHTGLLEKDFQARQVITFSAGSLVSAVISKANLTHLRTLLLIYSLLVWLLQVLRKEKPKLKHENSNPNLLGAST